jgi:hypothetical protein
MKVGFELLKLGLVGQVTHWVILKPVAHKIVGDYPWLTPTLMWGSVAAVALGAAAIVVAGQARLKKTKKGGRGGEQ